MNNILSTFFYSCLDYHKTPRSRNQRWNIRRSHNREIWFTNLSKGNLWRQVFDKVWYLLTNLHIKLFLRLGGLDAIEIFMHSEDGETFAYRNSYPRHKTPVVNINTINPVSKDVMIRIIKYVSRLNYNHFNHQFPKTLEELNIAEYKDIGKRKLRFTTKYFHQSDRKKCLTWASNRKIKADNSKTVHQRFFCKHFVYRM